jgi:hypothetical protein
MKISTLWAVLDPTPVSEMADICFEATPEDFCNWAAGSACLGRAPEDRNLTLYTTGEEAKADAQARIERRDKKPAVTVRLNVLDRARVVRYENVADRGYVEGERRNRAATMPSLVGQTVVIMDVSDGHGLSYRVMAPNLDGAKGREKALPPCWVEATELEPAPAV